MKEITFCPNCGGNLSDSNYVKKFSQASTLDWTGKILCPLCNYFGFFLSVPAKEYSKMVFAPRMFPSRPLPTSSFGPGPEFWLVGLIGICLLLAFLGVLLGYIK
jgi:hypothetical protein